MSDFWQGFVGVMIGALVMHVIHLFLPRNVEKRNGAYFLGGYQPTESDLDVTRPPQGGSGCLPKPPLTIVIDNGLHRPGHCECIYDRNGKLVHQCGRHVALQRAVTPDPSVQPPPFVEIDRGFET